MRSILLTFFVFDIRPFELNVAALVKLPQPYRKLTFMSFWFLYRANAIAFHCESCNVSHRTVKWLNGIALYGKTV